MRIYWLLIARPSYGKEGTAMKNMLTAMPGDQQPASLPARLSGIPCP